MRYINVIHHSSLLQLVDNLHQAGKTDNLMRVSGCVPVNGSRQKRLLKINVSTHSSKHDPKQEPSVAKDNDP